MKRPMTMLAAAWLAGLWLADLWPECNIKFVLISYVILIIISLAILKKYPKYLNSHVQTEWYPQLTLLILLIPCFLFAGHFRMEQEVTSHDRNAASWKELEQAGENYVLVQGRIKEKRCEDQVELLLEECMLQKDRTKKLQSAGNCLVTVAEGSEWLPETFPGNTVIIYGKFYTYREAGNPGQFDAHDYYTGKGIYALVKAMRIDVLNSETNGVKQAMFSLKQRMRESLTRLYPAEKAGVLAAMMLGDKDLLEEEIEELYRQNSISHILAISGLHISMLCMGLFRVLRKIGVSIKIAVAVSAAFLGFYVVYTGASTSALRAGIMCLVLFGARVFRRSYDLLSSLSVAAIIVTMIRPTELTSAGFLLSFGAMLGVALASEVEQHRTLEWEERKPWWSALLSAGMIQCMTLPISLWFFYELSPYSIFLNLVVIPLVSLIIGGGMISMLLGMLFPVVAQFPAGGTYLLLEFYERLGSITQKLPFSFVLVGRPTVWQLVLYYAVLFVAVQVFLKKKEKTVAVLAMGMLASVCVLLFWQGSKEELLFLDVSQGDAALLTTNAGSVILSDCGSSDVSAVGEYRLSPVLKQKGELLIDMAVVSHLDADHMSGIRELLDAMPVYEGKFRYAAGYKGAIGIKELVLPQVSEKSEEYLELEALAKKKKVAVRYVQAGELLYREETLVIECLSPYQARQSENETSLVFLVQTPKLLAWLMGDAGADSEAAIMERLKNVDTEAVREGKLVLLKVGHHGSKTSSSEDFITFVQPDIAVISCGYQNSYGHPHNSVLERLLKVDCQVFRTDLQGAVAVKSGLREEIVVESLLENH